MTVQLPVIPDRTGYDPDLRAWALEQAALRRAVRPEGIDWDNVAEEIESPGREQARQLASRSRTVIEHLLKYEYGQDRDQAGKWAIALLEQRQRLDDAFLPEPAAR